MDRTFQNGCRESLVNAGALKHEGPWLDVLDDDDDDYTTLRQSLQLRKMQLALSRLATT